MTYDSLIVERRAVAPARRLSLLAGAYVERGTKADWMLLHELHYKAESLPFGPRFYRCILDDQVIGVGVMSMSSAINRSRNLAFPQMRPNQGGQDNRLINRDRFIGLNKMSRTNSRLVLDTMYRGAGIAYRMQNLMLRMDGFELVEFQSSMSKFNPFAAKAGLRFVKPLKGAMFDIGIKWFRKWFASNPADSIAIMDELEAMKPAIRAACELDMRAFYYGHSAREQTGNNGKNGSSRVDAMLINDVLKNLQQLVLASPLYGVYFNPDHGRALPARLPLLAFDNQRTDEPLRLDLL